MILIPPGRKQRHSIAHSNARLNIWEGSVRSGKTIASIIRWLAFIVEAPPGPLLMVGKTRETLKRNVLDVIAELLDPADYRLVYGSGEVFIFGRKVLLGSANDERSEGKIRGLTLVGAYGDEMTLWPESFFTMLLSRLSVSGAKFFGTTNPDAPRHWFKAKYLDRSGELDMARFNFTLDDNPALDPGYVENLKLEYTGLWYKRYIEGLWVAAEGAIYDMFDPEQHTFSDVPIVRLTHAGIDYGTANPTVFHSGGLQDQALYVTGEWSYDGRTRGRSMTDAQYSQAFRDWINWPIQLRSIDVDPSAASFKAQLLQDGVRPVRSANNDVLDGIRVVSRALSNGQLFIHESCEGLISEMSSYSWDSKAQDRGEDAPMKVDDHHVDALRYMTMRALANRGLPSIPKPKAA